jgi:tight adherence protein B
MSIALAIVVALAVFSGAQFFVRRAQVSKLERRVRPHVQQSQLHEPSGGTGNRVRRLLTGAERALEDTGGYAAFVARLDRAGVTRRPIDVLALVAGASLAAALLSLAVGSGLAAVFVLGGIPLLTWVILGSLARRRVKLFDEQLPDVLAAISSSLRAGHGFLQSLQAVAYDAPEPTGGELRRALTETRLGRPVEDALGGIARRVPSRDFSYVLTAIAVQRQVGGSLAGLFETVNDTVRQRQQFTRKVRALTASGRTSANALIALPFGVALLLSAVNRSYLVPLFETHLGRLMLAGGLTALMLGTVLVRRIVSFKG